MRTVEELPSLSHSFSIIVYLAERDMLINIRSYNNLHPYVVLLQSHINPKLPLLLLLLLFLFYFITPSWKICNTNRNFCSVLLLTRILCFILVYFYSFIVKHDYNTFSTNL